MIVLDTSVLIDLLTGRDLPGARRLRQLEMDQTPFALPLPLVCGQEVLQGARDQREWALLFEYLGSQNLLFPRDLWTTHVNAARIYYDCRRKGITIRSSIDCLVAQMALDEEGVVLHNDEDYERIREVRPLRTLQS